MRKFWLKFREEITALIHIALFLGAYYTSFLVRFEFVVPEYYHRLFFETVLIVVGIKFVVFALFSVYKGSWRYVGIQDLVILGEAALVSSVIQGLLIYLFFISQGYPRSIVLLDFIMTMAFVGGVRLSLRMLRESFGLAFSPLQEDTHNVFILGAGDAGESLAREIRKYGRLNYKVVAFIDDNANKIGSVIHGIPILGPIEELAVLANRYNVKEVFIAIPSARGSDMRRIITACEGASCTFKTIPGMDRLIDGRVTVTKLREIQIEDLLRREPVVLDSKAISDFVSGRTVLVTGAGGSIGSEICRQVLRFGPRSLVLLERGETPLFEIENELRLIPGSGEKLFPYIADICDERRMGEIFHKHLPEVVFHAAAYKHVPMMENNIHEAVQNNIFGTKIISDLLLKTGGEAFVLISTDKAVNPTSVMGATKRMAEMYIQGIQQEEGPKFLAVRFGNVLGSTGSVIPMFKKQIQDGGPVTVTHPEMQRYFMTIPEAAQLVLQAASIGEGGEIYLLDMGEPIKIVDLARDLIKLSGLRPDEDVQIVFMGIRQGEKLFEELSLDMEDVDTTTHKKIFLVQSNGCSSEKVSKLIEDLQEMRKDCSEEVLRRKLMECVPEYKGWSGSRSVHTSVVKSLDEARKNRSTESDTKKRGNNK
jgi:FlaA1/EpsC-like NDP-sugar epimerase